MSPKIAQTAVNKLTIYLIKRKITKNAQIIKNNREPIIIRNVGSFYTDDSYTYSPLWLDSFFKQKLKNVNLFSASAKGVLVVKLRHRNINIIFAISFGAGWHIINDETIEEGFGLKVVLNSVDKDNIRSIQKSSIGAKSKISKEQMSKNSSTSDFGIDIEQDLVREVTGASKYSQLGKTVSGSDGLHLTVRVDIDNIKGFLISCYDKYISNDYKNDFEWIDQISHIKDHSLINNLEKILLRRYNKKKFEELWMAIPDLLDWTILKGFKYIPGREELSDDINIHDFRGSFGDVESLDKIRLCHVHAINAQTDKEFQRWNTFKCFYGEIKYKNKQYILNNGKWYEVNSDFVSKINSYYSRIKLSKIDLPDYDQDNEGEYNEELARSNAKYLLMDKKTVMHGGGKNRVEFCDIYTKDKKMIHIKHYGASAVLSHLFQQGMNAGEYLISDSDFRAKLNKILNDGWKIRNPNGKINPDDYEIILGIISRESEARPNIPFFSKVSIKNAVRRLNGYSFKVSLKNIKSLRI